MDAYSFWWGKGVLSQRADRTYCYRSSLVLDCTGEASLCTDYVSSSASTRGRTHMPRGSTHLPWLFAQRIWAPVSCLQALNRFVPLPGRGRGSLCDSNLLTKAALRRSRQAYRSAHSALLHRRQTIARPCVHRQPAKWRRESGTAGFPSMGAFEGLLRPPSHMHVDVDLYILGGLLNCNFLPSCLFSLRGHDTLLCSCVPAACQSFVCAHARSRTAWPSSCQPWGGLISVPRWGSVVDGHTHTVEASVSSSVVAAAPFPWGDRFDRVGLR